MDGRMDVKVIGRVVGGRWEGSGKMNGRVEWRVVGDWWDGGGRIVGGMVDAMGLLSSCNGDLRDRLVLPQGSQVPFRVARGPLGFLSSHYW